MTNDEVRSKVLDDHAMLRDRLDEIGELAARFEKGGVEVGVELRELGVALFESFASHLAFEDAQLVPALRAIPERGKELADRLEREHREQRELLDYLLNRLEEEKRPTTLVARELEGFSAYLRVDMSYEESMILRENLFNA
jgi:hemerythrin-like domain-containing protein